MKLKRTLAFVLMLAMLLGAFPLYTLGFYSTKSDLTAKLEENNASGAANEILVFNAPNFKGATLQANSNGDQHSIKNASELSYNSAYITSYPLQDKLINSGGRNIYFDSSTNSILWKSHTGPVTESDENNRLTFNHSTSSSTNTAGKSIVISLNATKHADGFTNLYECRICFTSSSNYYNFLVIRKDGTVTANSESVKIGELGDTSTNFTVHIKFVKTSETATTFNMVCDYYKDGVLVKENHTVKTGLAETSKPKYTQIFHSQGTIKPTKNGTTLTCTNTDHTGCGETCPYGKPLISLDAIRMYYSDECYDTVHGTEPHSFTTYNPESGKFRCACGKEMKRITLEGYSVSLTENIGINFYAKPGDNVKTAKITVAGKTTDIDISSLTPEENGTYKLTANVSSINMSEDIKLAYYAEGGNMIPVSTASETYADGYVTSVKNYATELIEDTAQADDVKLIAKALLNYGAFSEKYFGKDTSLATAYDIEEAEAAVADVDPAYITGTVIGTSEKLGEAKLVLGNTTKIRIMLNSAAVVTGGDNIVYVDDGNKYHVDICGIDAANLDTTYTFTVDGSEVKVSALGVAGVVANDEEKYGTDFANLMKALYLYSAAADGVTVIPQHYINGTLLSEYTIVYDADSLYSQYSAMILSEFIAGKYDVTLPYQSDAVAESEYEILLGDTNRIDGDADTGAGLGKEEYMIETEGSKLLLVADGYMIGGAAGGFMDLCRDSEIENTVNLIVSDDPVLKKYEYKQATSALLYIGDGMGENHIEWAKKAQGLSKFYAEDMPYIGYSTTYSADNAVTDSAAGGTALATGYKTNNNYLGMLPDGVTSVQNIRELAHLYGANTAVLTTDPSITGATPSAFTVHTTNRTNTDEIKSQQAALLASGGIDVMIGGIANDQILPTSQETLLSIGKWGESFFMMLEEGKIDTFSHNNNESSMTSAVKRFNDTIAFAMQFALIRGDVLLVVTADHETGGVTKTDGGYEFTATNHTGANVKVFAMGDGAELFDGTTVDNVMIPQVIAPIFGAVTFGSGSLYDGFTIGTYNEAYAIEEYTGTASSIIIPGSYNGKPILCIYSFAGNTSIENVTITEGVTMLGYGAFQDCTNLKSVTLPGSINTLNWYAFSGCESLTSITFKGTVEEWNAISKNNDWNAGTGEYTVYCTDGEISKSDS